MVIYEVNLSVNNEIFQEYYEWLLFHIHELLALKGFMQSEIGLVENQNDDNKNHLRVSYTIDSYENLQHYLTNNAPTMRSDSLQRFGDKFSATCLFCKAA